MNEPKTTDVTYEFNNGSYTKIISYSDSKRGKRADLAIRQAIEYWSRYPDKYIEFMLGIKLPWYQKNTIEDENYTDVMEQYSEIE